MWQENWKRAVAILLDVHPNDLIFAEDYARNIVLGGYMDSAEERFGDAGLYEFACRPCWSKAEQNQSRVCTALGQPHGDWTMPPEAKAELKSAIIQIQNSQ